MSNDIWNNNITLNWYGVYLLLMEEINN